MTMIQIKALDNGAHINQTFHSILPEGWAVIPDDMECENFPFGEVETEEIDGVMTVTKWTAGVIPNPEFDPVEARSKKETEISNTCNAAIVAGMDVETSVGVEHFSLQETDQINLTTATNAVQNGAASYPYHADGSLCRMFSAEEILVIANAATQHKLYHTTLCNHILTWVRRAETVEEIENITYSAENLPEDLAENMANIFASVATV